MVTVMWSHLIGCLWPWRVTCPAMSLELMSQVDKNMAGRKQRAAILALSSCLHFGIKYLFFANFMHVYSVLLLYPSPTTATLYSGIL